jgi:hypothetical protein
MRKEKAMICKLTILFCSLMVLSGCATHPISNADAVPVSMDRIFDSSFLQMLPGTGAVTIKRDSGLTGSNCSTRIFVDGRPVADIRTSEKIVLHLPEGEHILSAWPNEILCGGVVEVKTSIKAGTESSYRVGWGDAGDMSINPTAF